MSDTVCNCEECVAEAHGRNMVRRMVAEERARQRGERFGEYDRALAAWEALPRWRRWITPKPAYPWFPW
jgi:hypothetical protein